MKKDASDAEHARISALQDRLLPFMWRDIWCIEGYRFLDKLGMTKGARNDESENGMMKEFEGEKGLKLQKGLL